MQYKDSRDTLQSGYRYILSTFEDTENEYGGPYFKVQRVAANTNYINSLDEETRSQLLSDINSDSNDNDNDEKRYSGLKNKLIAKIKNGD